MAVAVCGSWSRLVQVTVVPALTVTIAGEKAKFWIATVSVATGAAWSDAAAGGGASASGADAVGRPPQPPRRAIPTATAGMTRLISESVHHDRPSPCADPPDGASLRDSERGYAIGPSGA
jgi:hypothetical protein